jgi:hypothetical protein
MSAVRILKKLCAPFRKYSDELPVGRKQGPANLEKKKRVAQSKPEKIPAESGLTISGFYDYRH